MTDLQGCNQQPQNQDIRLGLFGAVSRSKPPLLQFIDGYWRCWTSYDSTLSHGTYIALSNDGSMCKVTILPDGTETFTNL